MQRGSQSTHNEGGGEEWVYVLHEHTISTTVVHQHKQTERVERVWGVQEKERHSRKGCIQLTQKNNTSKGVAREGRERRKRVFTVVL